MKVAHIAARRLGRNLGDSFVFFLYSSSLYDTKR